MGKMKLPRGWKCINGEGTVLAVYQHTDGWLAFENFSVCGKRWNIYLAGSRQGSVNDLKEV